MVTVGSVDTDVKCGTVLRDKGDVKLKFLREEELNVSKGTAWVECYWEVMLVKDGAMSELILCCEWVGGGGGVPRECLL